jgi:hypothetical protein
MILGMDRQGAHQMTLQVLICASVDVQVLEGEVSLSVEGVVARATRPGDPKRIKASGVRCWVGRSAANPTLTTRPALHQYMYHIMCVFGLSQILHFSCIFLGAFVCAVCMDYPRSGTFLGAFSDYPRSCTFLGAFVCAVCMERFRTIPDFALFLNIGWSVCMGVCIGRP